MGENSGNNDSFIRWQAITIGQLSYAINLILGFSVAALGFGVSLLLNENFSPVSWQKCIFGSSLLMLIGSISFGVWCTINRLRDFRATTKIAKIRENGNAEQELQILRQLSEKLGKKTWGIFWWQIGAFTAGILLMVAGVAFSVSEKLL